MLTIIPPTVPRGDWQNNCRVCGRSGDGTAGENIPPVRAFGDSRKFRPGRYRAGVDLAVNNRSPSRPDEELHSRFE